MKIGILGAGHIGKTLARTLAAAGHDVKVANSRGPETIGADVLETGARAVTTAEAVENVDAVILSIPLNRIPDVAPLIQALPAETVVIDTSNYYPMRDGRMAAFDEGQVETVWLSELFGRPVVKAWNAITAQSFDAKSTEAGDPHRVAIPVAADRDADRAVAIELVEDTGFAGFDAGTLDESWRQQPGAPVYCTDRSPADISGWLAAAKKDRVPQRRDLAMEVIGDYAEAGGTVDGNFLVSINRACYA